MNSLFIRVGAALRRDLRRPCGLQSRHKAASTAPLRQGPFSLGGAILLLALLNTAPAASDVRSTFMLEQAYGQLAAATTPDDFLAAARFYERILAEGRINGPILYNTGTAMLLAGRHDEALYYLDRAERHLGSTWEIDRNRQLARQKLGELAHELDWRQAVFFWHHGLQLSSRLWLATASFFLIWFLLTLRACGIRRSTGVLLVLVTIAFALTGSSVLTTWMQEWESTLFTPPPPLEGPP